MTTLTATEYSHLETMQPVWEKKWENEIETLTKIIAEKIFLTWKWV